MTMHLLTKTIRTVTLYLAEIEPTPTWTDTIHDALRFPPPLAAKLLSENPDWRSEPRFVIGGGE